MRIIAGKFKRHQLITLEGTDTTRPTSDRVKESIFNILQNSLTDTVVLDLFAGSGALGIEALSRGAVRAFFVEENHSAAQCLQKNVSSLELTCDQTQIYILNVSRFLSSKPLLSDNKVDIIFADPPYSSTWYDTALAEIENSHVCNDGCLVVFELPHNKEIPAIQSHHSPWEMLDARKYGKTKIEIWRYNETTH